MDLPKEEQRNFRYDMRILDHNEAPMVNFAILHFQSNLRPSEVWFGWGYFKGCENGLVFRSNNPELTTYFQSLFEALKDNAIKNDKSKKCVYTIEGLIKKKEKENT